MRESIELCIFHHAKGKERNNYCEGGEEINFIRDDFLLNPPFDASK